MATNMKSGFCGDVFDLLCKNDCLTQPKISFALSLLAQRIRTKPIIFYDNLKKSDFVAYVVDLMSLLSGAENLSSLMNVMNSEFSQNFEIVKQVEDLLGGHPVLKSRSWSIVTCEKFSERLPNWTF